MTLNVAACNWLKNYQQRTSHQVYQHQGLSHTNGGHLSKQTSSSHISHYFLVIENTRLFMCILSCLGLVFFMGNAFFFVCCEKERDWLTWLEGGRLLSDTWLRCDTWVPGQHTDTHSKGTVSSVYYCVWLGEGGCHQKSLCGTASHARHQWSQNIHVHHLNWIKYHFWSPKCLWQLLFIS